MIPRVVTCPDFAVDVGQAFIQHWTPSHLRRMWDVDKLIALLRCLASPPGGPIRAVLGQNIDAERLLMHQNLMHVSLFIDAHQNQWWIEGDRGKGVGAHAVFDITVTGGHHRHTCRKPSQHLSKQHRIKWHNVPPGQLPHGMSRTHYLTRDTRHVVQPCTGPVQGWDENRIRDEWSAFPLQSSLRHEWPAPPDSPQNPTR